MKEISWDSSFSVGLESIDLQHKEIIKLINTLITNSEATVRSETISEVLTRLTKYAGEHFRSEERLLEKYGYSDIEDHRQEHNAYREKIVRLCVATMAEVNNVPDELLLYLREWWVKHILESDMAYKSFILERAT